MAFTWPAWLDVMPPTPDGGRMVPWHFIAEGDSHIDYAAHQDHDFAVWCGGSWWCAGCVAHPPSRFTTDAHPGWPSLVSAPNGLRVVLAYQPAERVARRPLCPRRSP